MPDNHGPSRARLFSDAVYYQNNGTYNRGSWVAGVTNQQQYIQVIISSAMSEIEHVRQAKIRISLHIRTAGSESSLGAFWWQRI